ncbi:hypothetical protein GCM10008927_26880 [Amylibacter ulvae]|uniref:Heparinase II/III-like C-terminal domain-containing protein n=1 Tax=Paramylibacter ulvae TaxID=1651968 RepID=A0ABQ3D9J3_9RHOB|nr:heparinase II/III family protein [Amylibacter ulvae]GHA59887.1 hypothetical protein GCM10008927_26880 [Amylibacter ulvae]
MGFIGTDIGNAIAAQLTRFARPAKAFVSYPQPKSIGLPNRGMQLISGNFLFAGELVVVPDGSIWDAEPKTSAFAKDIHGFAWLDDLVALGTKDSKAISKDWLWHWIEHCGSGAGAGWSPHITGRRVIRWVNHALLLLQGEPAERSVQYFKSLGHQASFLSRRWKAAPVGLPRFEALVGLVYCGLALETKTNLLEPALRSLGAECQKSIQSDGSIQSRNPEELLQIFTLLTWAAQSLSDAGHVPHREHLLAMERIVPTLRALRLGDGGLVYFHGGGRGREGLLDQTLADASIRLDAYPLGGMGYARLSQSGVTVLVDTGDQPTGALAHNSPLAFEVSAGKYPIFVNVGPGHYYGEEWHSASAEVGAHNTVSILGKAPEKNAEMGKNGEIPRPVVTHSENEEYQMLVCKHSGYVHTHGLEHFRTIDVARNGRIIRGRDRLVAEGADATNRFDNWMTFHGKYSMPINAHFHIHPDVDAQIGMNGRAVSLHLPDGTVWVFQSKNSKIEIQDSAYVEDGRLKMRATKQIVVTSQATDYEGSISWSLTRG